jgi:hypothetical protein
MIKQYNFCSIVSLVREYLNCVKGHVPVKSVYSLLLTRKLIIVKSSEQQISKDESIIFQFIQILTFYIIKSPRESLNKKYFAHSILSILFASYSGSRLM